MNIAKLVPIALLALAGTAAAQDQDPADQLAAAITAQAYRIIQARNFPPGVRIIDGDMVFPASFNPDIDAFFQVNQWPGGVVPYEFDAASLNAQDVINGNLDRKSKRLNSSTIP